jgi:hypothetical protein
VNLQIDLPEIGWLSLLLAGAGCLLGWLWYGPLFGRAWKTPVDRDKPAARWAATAIVYATYFVAFVTAAGMVPQILGPHPQFDAVIRAGLIAAAGLAFGIYAWFTLTTDMTFGQVAISAGYYTMVFPMIIVVVGLYG